MHQGTSGPSRIVGRFDTRHLWLLVLFAVQTGLLIWIGVIRPSRMVVKGVDPPCYYAYLRSITFDRDLDFRNELERLQEAGLPEIVVVPKTGRVGNVFSLGPALFLSPFYLVGHIWTVADERYPADGYSPPYQISCFVGLAVFGLVGIFLCYSAATKIFSKRTAFLAVSGGWLATSTAYYVYPIELMPHSISFCLTALFLRIWMGLRDEEEISIRNWVLLGFIGGLAMLVRWQDLLFLSIPVVDRLWTRRFRVGAGVEPMPKLSLGAVVVYFVGAISAFTPQMIAWWRIYGSPITIPQGEGFLRFARPDVFHLLFGMRNGLILWTPITALGLLGLVSIAKNRNTRSLGAAFIVAIVGQVYINGIVSDVYGGMGFGMRRFVCSMPVLIMGTASAIDWISKRFRFWQAACVVVFLIGWNFLFLFQYYTGMIPWDRPPTWNELVADKINVYSSFQGLMMKRSAEYLLASAVKSADVEERKEILARARETVDLAVQLAPKKTECWITRAAVYEAGRDRTQSIQSLSEACKLLGDAAYIEHKFRAALKSVGLADRIPSYEPFFLQLRRNTETE